METSRSTDTLLTPAEERDLARAIEAGLIAQHVLDTGGPCPLGTDEELAAVATLGKQARDRFLAANMGLVVHVVRRDARSSSEQDDLVQEGFLGLVEALETFDWARGTRFSTWAVPYVRGRVAAARRLDRGGIRVPARRMRAAAAAGEQALTMSSIHGLEELESTWWQESPHADDDAPGWEELSAALDGLSAQERSVLAHRYGLAGDRALTQVATARRLRLPVKRVRASEESAIRYLREAVAAQW